MAAPSTLTADQAVNALLARIDTALADIQTEASSTCSGQDRATLVGQSNALALAKANLAAGGLTDLAAYLNHMLGDDTCSPSYRTALTMVDGWLGIEYARIAPA